MDTQTETINGVLIEFGTFEHDRKAYFRAPNIYPVNARQWHGPFDTVDEARADVTRRTTKPVLTQQEYDTQARLGYAGEIDGVPTILHMCPLTHATAITAVEIIKSGAR